MSKEIRRLYNMKDAIMLNRAGVIALSFSQNIDDFAVLDSRFNAAYVTLLEDKIRAASSCLSHDQSTGIQRVLTHEVGVAMEHCRNKYLQVRYFSKLAFKGKPAVVNEFGKKDYLACREKQYKMAGFMDELYKTCVKHQVVLIAEGLSAAQITEIQTLGNLLRDANSEQENYKRNGMVLTEERIIALNECYTILTTIRSAAQVIYRNDYPRYRVFALDKRRKKRSDEEE